MFALAPINEGINYRSVSLLRRSPNIALSCRFLLRRP